MSNEFRAHTGQRKRPRGGKEIASFQERRAGSLKERETAARMFAGDVLLCMSETAAECEGLGCVNLGTCQRHT